MNSMSERESEREIKRSRRGDSGEEEERRGGEGIGYSDSYTEDHVYSSVGSDKMV